jgi:Fic family protein
LMEEGVLTTPALSISSFLKQHQAEYYDRMSEVRSTGNYEQWVKFFLQAVYESASDAIAAIEELTALLDTHVHLIAGMGCASGTTMRLFSYLETHPIIDIESTASSLEMAFNTAEGAIERLIQAGILHQATTTRRGRTFVYTDYLGLLRKGTE